ncbi:1,2-phenylacetyl-CoA epoxidase subunit PaaC [Candidatus Poriferisodalis sp.]|uniref:1,2-phenylacetyl-CoA epoxidase subunit PaaC n=1 Tax=Candidatus Poriferisodalis sp. TaxID=3101277 RepID=UPI003B025613
MNDPEARTPVAAVGATGYPSHIEGAREFVLALADDELCIGQNLGWWIAVGPFLEEDLALTSISQDELGHARALYGLLGGDIDAMAYGREPHEYLCAHITELPCHDWAETLVRHFLYDTAETVRWRALVNSSWESLGAVARRALAEERSHLRHASGLLDRLLRTEQGIAHLLPLFDQLVPMASELFDAPAGPGDEPLVTAGVMACELSTQRAQWQEVVDDALGAAGYQPQWPVSDGAATAYGGRAGQRSSHFSALHAEMVEVLSIDPTARW